MTLHEEIRKKQKEYFENATTYQKLVYLIRYYGVRTLITCISLFLVVIFIYKQTTEPECILNGTFVNYNVANTSLDKEVLAKNFLTEKNFDTSQYKAEFRTNITIAQSSENADWKIEQNLYAQIASGVLDFAVGELEFLDTYAYGHHFNDLTVILTEKQIELFKPYFLYIDMDVLSKRHETQEDIPFPDFRKPDEMKQPIPVMLDLSNFPIIQEIYGSNCSNICYGIIKKGENQENAIKFLEYLSQGM